MSVSEHSKDDGENDGEICASRRSLSPDRHRTAEEMAPDGGWGWIIFAGTTLSNIICFSGFTTLGMIYGEYLTETGSGGSALMILNVANFASFSFSGLFGNELLKRYEIKSIGLFSALLYAVSSILMVFMPSIGYMAITQFLEGFGAGSVVCITTTSLNSYFVKRRAMVFALIHVIPSIASIFYPYLFKHLLSTYGFHGCLVIWAGIGFNTVCCMLVIEPVETHCKKPKLGSRKVSANCDREMVETDLSSNAQNIDPEINLLVDPADGWNNGRSVQCLRAQTETEKPLLIETSMITATSMVSMSREENLCDVEQQIIELEKKDVAKVNTRITSILADFFEISLLRDIFFLNMCLGMTFVFLADLGFTNFLPLILADDGYTTDEIALVLTVAAVAEVVSRIGLVIFTMLFKAKAKHIFFGSICVFFLSRIAFLYCYTLSSVISVVVIIYCPRAWFLVVQFLVIAEQVAIERYSAAYGLFIVINGTSSLIYGPVIGWIKDWTESYVVMQLILLGTITLCIVPWALEILICDILPRYKKQNKNSIVEIEFPMN